MTEVYQDLLYRHSQPEVSQSVLNYEGEPKAGEGTSDSKTCTTEQKACSIEAIIIMLSQLI